MTDTLTVRVEKDATVSIDTLEVLIEMAGFGVTYWATHADWDRAGRTWTLHHHQDPDDTESPVQHSRLTYQHLADALARVYSGSTNAGRATEDNVRTELDDPESGGAEFDSDDADQVVQVALFGTVLYG